MILCSIVMCKMERNEHLMDRAEQRWATQRGRRGAARGSAPTAPGSLRRAALPPPPTASRYGDSRCRCPSPPSAPCGAAWKWGCWSGSLWWRWLLGRPWSHSARTGQCTCRSLWQRPPSWDPDLPRTREKHRGCLWQACSSPSSPSAIRWSNHKSRGSWRGRDAPGNKWAEIQERGGWWGCCCSNGGWSGWSGSQRCLPQCKQVGFCPGTEPPVPPSHWTRCWTRWLAGSPRGWAFWDGWGPWRQAQGDQTTSCHWGRSFPTAQGPGRLDRESR